MHPNLSSYNEVENLATFDENSFYLYCHSKLNECNKHSTFIKKLLARSSKSLPLTVFEIGSGNSKLLYRLEADELISCGIGFEVSESRVDFANAFKKLMNSKLVVNINEPFDNNFDFSVYQAPDLIIGVDIVLQLIAPISHNSLVSTLTLIRKILKPGGFLILELWSLSTVLTGLSNSGGELKIWEEYLPPDPWQYCLSKINTLASSDISWEKTFLSRDSNKKSLLSHIIRPLNREQILSQLYKAGFTKVEFSTHWAQAGDIDHDEFIVVAS